MLDRARRRAGCTRTGTRSSLGAARRHEPRRRRPGARRGRSPTSCSSLRDLRAGGPRAAPRGTAPRRRAHHRRRLPREHPARAARRARGADRAGIVARAADLLARPARGRGERRRHVRHVQHGHRDGAGRRSRRTTRGARQRNAARRRSGSWGPSSYRAGVRIDEESWHVARPAVTRQHRPRPAPPSEAAQNGRRSDPGGPSLGRKLTVWTHDGAPRQRAGRRRRAPGRVGPAVRPQRGGVRDVRRQQRARGDGPDRRHHPASWCST